jgi:hypothetical protein
MIISSKWAPMMDCSSAAFRAEHQRVKRETP